MDESGHDHKKLPYEVRGGVAIHAKKIWPFVQSVQSLEVQAFGASLSDFWKEFKGMKLLDKDRFKWAVQSSAFTGDKRRKHARSFLHKGSQQKKPCRDEFTAYGQACMEMVRGVFRLIREHDGVLFAACIPRGVKRSPGSTDAREYLRKDHVFLLERFYYFLEAKQEHGLLVMDQVEDSDDRRFVRRLEAYFTKTQTGRFRTTWIVPSPIFVSSAMSIPVQVADLCIYCMNWGFGLPSLGMNAPVRSEIADEFGPWLRQLQFRGDGYRDGEVFRVHGIVYVPDPYTGRT